MPSVIISITTVRIMRIRQAANTNMNTNATIAITLAIQVLTLCGSLTSDVLEQGGFSWACKLHWYFDAVCVSRVPQCRGADIPQSQECRNAGGDTAAHMYTIYTFLIYPYISDSSA